MAVFRNIDDLRIRRSSTADADLDTLSRMNRRLIEDEGSPNRMAVADLKRRMQAWLTGDWTAALIELKGNSVGYVLFQHRSDEYDAAAREVYVRQFFVAREQRRQGIGQAAFQLIRSQLFPESATIVLDVLTKNQRGLDFWKSLGFETHCLTMKARG